MDKNNLAYVVGIAIGDGNLSNPNGRAVRLRISCDTKYPNLIKGITLAIQKLLPNNKVSLVKRKRNCVDISCYSNQWEGFLGWKAKGGSKYKQNISVPIWIKKKKTYVKFCLKGLLETDGSIYFDRNYPMVNFVTIIPNLAKDVIEMISSLEFKANIQKLQTKNSKIKHTIRVSKNAEAFIKSIRLRKS